MLRQLAIHMEENQITILCLPKNKFYVDLKAKCKKSNFKHLKEHVGKYVHDIREEFSNQDTKKAQQRKR